MKPGSHPILDSEVKHYLDLVLSSLNTDRILAIDYAQYDRAWRNWLGSSSYNSGQALDQMPYSSFCHGTSPAFGEFISRHPQRRIRVSRSDFIISKILAKAYQRDIVWIEDQPLAANDCVIVSMPFSGNGSWLPDIDALLDAADHLGVPVMIDAAYFGISFGISYPLHRPCVTDFVCSLSKNLYCNDIRVGIRFTKHAVDDGVSVAQIMANCFNRLNAVIGIELLNKFSHDWLVNKYLAQYFSICDRLTLTPTNTLTLALGDESQQEFLRGDYVRVCISDEFC